MAVQMTPEEFDQAEYEKLMEDVDNRSDLTGYSGLPKSVAPMGFQERVSVAESNFYDESATISSQFLKGKPRMPSISADKYRDLSIEAVIALLDDHNRDVKANAAGYLQHLSFDKEDNKNLIRTCGGIPKLIDILEERNDDPRIVENTTGALRNISYGVDQNKISINVAEGVGALNKALRRATAKLENQTSAQVNQWSLVQVHAAGALWNLSSHKLLKPPMLDQSLSTIVTSILTPWARHMANGSSGAPPSKYTDAFTAVSGILRNLSSYSPSNGPDSARDRMRGVEGLMDSMCDIVSGIPKYSVEILDGKYFENIICALRNLTYRAAKQANQPICVNPQVIVKASCFTTKRVEATYKKPEIPEDDIQSRGTMRIFQPSFVANIIHLLKNSTNMITTEAALGIIQNLTSDNFRTSLYLRAFIRDINGIPVIVQYVECIDATVCHSAIVALRNLSEDLDNKKVVGKYGLQHIATKIPVDPTYLQQATSAHQRSYTSKSAVAALYLVRLLINLNHANAELLLSTNALKAIVNINKNAQFGDPIRKAAGQVLVVAWDVTSMRKQYKKIKLTEKDFKPAVQAGEATMRKSKATTNGLSPESEKLISDTNV